MGQDFHPDLLRGYEQTLFGKLLGIVALILLALMLFGRFIGLPLWLWGAVFGLGLVLYIVDKAATKRNTPH